MQILAEGETDGDLRYFRPAIARFVWWGTGRWLALGALVILGLALLLTAEAGWRQETAVPVILALALLAASFSTPFISVPSMVSGDSRNQGRIRFVVTEESYTTQSAAASQTTRLDAYKKAYVDDRFVYLVLGQTSVNVLALKFVADPKPLIDHLAQIGLLRPTPRSFFVL